MKVWVTVLHYLTLVLCCSGSTEVDGKQKLTFELWHQTSKGGAILRTITSHINNMFVGVTQGFRYQIRAVYAHFPINVGIEKGGSQFEIRNFLGEKRTRVVRMLEGVKCSRDSTIKDSYFLEGNDIENVSHSAAQIHDICLVRHKDIRKFLDGMYISKKGPIPEA